MTLRGIRGATTARENTREAILDASRELLGALIQANNLCRELVYGSAAAPIQEPAKELSDAEITSLVLEYEHLSEAVSKNPAASDSDRKELDKIGDMIAGTISGK